MAKKTDLFYGDQGDGVKELQTALNNLSNKGSGNLLIVDGIYGDKTKAAVAKAMKRFGLDGDGSEIGTDFWDAITGNSPPKATTPGTPITNTPSNTTNKPNNSTNSNTYTPVAAPTLNPAPTAPTYDNTRYGDTEGGKETWSAYEEALKAVNSHGKFEYGNQEQLDAIMNSILNREKFSYDLNGDALYQQYKDKAIQQGKMAMGDAIGQAQAMTGGYGNSYAQSVGQQAYQAQLQNLNDIVPELYQMAYDKYNNEGQELYNQYGMLTEDYNRGYSEHMDKYTQLMDMLGIKRSDYYDGANMFYTEQGNTNDAKAQAFADALAIWGANNDNAWKKASFEEDARRWAKEIGLSEEQLALALKQFELSEKELNHKISEDTLGNEGETVQPKETKNTTAFISRYRTKSEYLASGHSLNEWNEYMEGNIASFLRSGRITDEEAQYLIEYYGLE